MTSRSRLGRTGCGPPGALSLLYLAQSIRTRIGPPPSLFAATLPVFGPRNLPEAEAKSLPLSSLRKAPLGESGIRPHRLLGLGKSLSVLRVCSLKRQYLHRDKAREGGRGHRTPWGGRGQRAHL